MDQQNKLAILKHAREINSNPIEHKETVIEIIRKLNLYIKDELQLSQKEIKELCSNLTYFTSYTTIKIVKNTIISRATDCTEDNHCHKTVSRLSYIPKKSKITPDIGRMNKHNEKMFYGCLQSNNSSICTVLSETDAEKDQYFNILISKVKKDLYVIPIGALDYIRKGINAPFNIVQNNFVEIYTLYKQTVAPDGMIALELCDAFLNDILKRNYTDKEIIKRHYEITSEIARDCLNFTKADGIIYPSVKFEGFPNIVLNPNSVDHKLHYERAASIKVLDKHDYGIYTTKTVNLGFISDKSDIIDWQNANNLPIANNVIFME